MTRALAKGRAGDLSPTALYTAGAWAWAGMPGAELLAFKGTRRVFGAVNAGLALARLFYRRPPSLRHSLVQRHLMIDHLLAESGCRHVLELAAGLSARGLRASGDAAVSYVELDQPQMMARKRDLLARSAAGRAALARANLKLVDGDIADTALAELAPPPPEPLFVVAEGLLMYLDEAAQQRLFARVHELLAGRGGGAFVFDLVPAVEQPRAGLIARAFGRVFRAATRGGAFARDARTREDLAAALRAAGFSVELLEPATAPAAWKLPHLERRTQQLLFVCKA